MPFLKQTSKRFLSVLAITSGLLAGIPILTVAQSNSGLTLWSGIQRENILNYHLDFDGHAGSWDRYRFYISAKKLTQGASKFIIAYPDYYDGKFDTDRIEVRIDKESLPLRSVYWDKEGKVIEIDMEQPIPPGKKVEIVFSNVKNPRFGGTFYFHCQAFAADDLPVRLYYGTWIVSINN
jgi:hypothetical protein